MNKQSTNHEAPIRLNDIAERAKVSRITVSKVLLGTGGQNVRVSESTRKKILEIAEKMKYRPNMAARMLTGKKSRLIGVLIDSQAPGIFFNCLGLIEKSLAEKGYRCMIAQQHDNIGSIVEYLADFTAYGVEGVISFAHDYPEFKDDVSSLMKYLHEVVFIGKPIVPGSYYVESDISHGIDSLVRHLVVRGKKRIGIMLINREHRVMQSRYNGYISGLKESNYPFNENLVLINRNFKDVSESNAAFVYEMLVEKEKCDAVIAPNDLHAMALIRKLIDCGYRVPQDVAVTGCDNIDAAKYMNPSVTTIKQRVDLLARNVVELLSGIVSDKAPEKKGIVVKPELIIREST